METKKIRTSSSHKDKTAKLEAAKRRAARKAKLARALENRTKKENPPKKYNIMVGYDQLLEVDVRNILKENKINPQMITDSYFYISAATVDMVNLVKKVLRGLKFEFKAPDGSVRKIYKIRYFSASRYDEPKEKKEKKEKKPSNNTKARQEAANNKKKFAKCKVKKGNKRKNLRGKHSSGSNFTNYERKTLARVKKACKYLAKQEAKKAVEAPKKAKSKGIKKPVQQKLKFAA